MDVLATYVESKEALNEVAKQILNILENNDEYSIIRSSDVRTIAITPHKTDDQLVEIALFSYEDLNKPVVSFNVDRRIALEVQEREIISKWHETCVSIIQAANTAKARLFLRNFGPSDFELIRIVMDCHERVVDTKTPLEIASISSKILTVRIQDKFANKGAPKSQNV